MCSNEDLPVLSLCYLPKPEYVFVLTAVLHLIHTQHKTTRLSLAACFTRMYISNKSNSYLTLLFVGRDEDNVSSRNRPAAAGRVSLPWFKICRLFCCGDFHCHACSVVVFVYCAIAVRTE